MSLMERELELSCELFDCPHCGRRVTTTASEGVPCQSLRNCDECGGDFFAGFEEYQEDKGRE